MNILERLYKMICKENSNIIKTVDVEAEILQQDELKMTLKVINVNDQYIKRYIRPDDIIVLKKHTHFSGETCDLWEVDPATMQRSASQLLLYNWYDTGWSWELDS